MTSRESSQPCNPEKHKVLLSGPALVLGHLLLVLCSGAAEGRKSPAMFAGKPGLLEPSAQGREGKLGWSLSPRSPAKPGGELGMEGLLGAGLPSASSLSSISGSGWAGGSTPNQPLNVRLGRAPFILVHFSRHLAQHSMFSLKNNSILKNQYLGIFFYMLPGL